ncbi:MAG: hypothetical protein KGO92_07635 [Bacteroidota bacterium]|nr:hypothetical protein [Bacteroidota bacterium]
MKKLWIFWLAGLLCLSATTSKKHTVWFYINNSSQLNQPVDLSLSIIPKDEKAMMVANQELKTGLQELPSQKLSEGVYEIRVAANQNQLNLSQMLTIDSDRWVIINYEVQDSATIVQTNGFLDTTHYKKVSGDKYASMYLYIDNRRPPNL